MHKRLFSIIFLGCLLSFTALAQNARVDVHLDATRMLVGEQVRLHIKVTAPAKSKVVFPEFDQGYLTDGLEVLAQSPVDTIAASPAQTWVLERTYLLTAFDSATYTIPHQEIEVNGSKILYKNEIKLHVENIEVDLKHPENLRPAHPPLAGAFEWNFSLFGWCLILWLLVGSFLFLLVLLSRNRPLVRKVKVVPPMPPHQTAISAMEQLKEADHHDHDAQKAYFIQLTDVLRTYLKARFDFNAKEMTTSEIIAHLRASDDDQALLELRDILDTADLVKFAHYEASLAERDRTLLLAIHYVQTTRLETSSTLPQEEWIEMPHTKQLRIKQALSVGAILNFIALLCVFNYIGYLLWLNFL